MSARCQYMNGAYAACRERAVYRVTCDDTRMGNLCQAHWDNLTDPFPGWVAVPLDPQDTQPAGAA